MARHGGRTERDGERGRRTHCVLLHNVVDDDDDDDDDRVSESFSEQALRLIHLRVCACARIPEVAKSALWLGCGRWGEEVFRAADPTGPGLEQLRGVGGRKRVAGRLNDSPATPVIGNHDDSSANAPGRSRVYGDGAMRNRVLSRSLSTTATGGNRACREPCGRRVVHRR